MHMKNRFTKLFLIITAYVFFITAPGNTVAIESAYSVPGKEMQKSGAMPVNGILVFQSDFGLKDAAVSAMKGVAMGVSQNLRLFDVTHEIPAGKIWDASFRLYQTVTYWPQGTVFVSVIDPGVGSERKSIVVLLESGHYIVTPDNGTITLLADTVGIREVRVIDEETNRLPDSYGSDTFHGRDVYAYTGARLASHIINYDEVGPILETPVQKLRYTHASFKNGTLNGCINITDVQYGNLWTNIGRDTMRLLHMSAGKSYKVEILRKGRVFFSGQVRFCNTFSDVPEGKPLLYINSLGNLAVALNMGNFASRYGISYGEDWKISISEK